MNIPRDSPAGRRSGPRGVTRKRRVRASRPAKVRRSYEEKSGEVESTSKSRRTRSYSRGGAARPAFVRRARQTISDRFTRARASVARRGKKLDAVRARGVAQSVCLGRMKNLISQVTTWSETPARVMHGNSGAGLVRRRPWRQILRLCASRTTAQHLSDVVQGSHPHATRLADALYRTLVAQDGTVRRINSVGHFFYDAERHPRARRRPLSIDCYRNQRSMEGTTPASRKKMESGGQLAGRESPTILTICSR